MRSDCPSIPTRGSRLVGLLSIIITSVLGSGACEQERRGSSNPPTKNKKLVILTLSEERGKDVLLGCARAAALRIRDFSQNRGPFRSRSRRNIAWTPMPRLIGEQGESDRFLRFRRKAELIREMQSDS